MRILLFLYAGTLSAQIFGIGVKGGAQLTSDLDSFFATSESKRYVVGPMATARLPAGFRFEFDALYRRAGFRSGGSDFVFSVFTASRDRGNSWEFPLVLRRTLWHGLYAGAGYVPRVINGGGHSTVAELIPTNPPRVTVFETDTSGRWQTTHGVAGVAGIEKRLGPLRFTPEVRYTFWTRPSVEEFGSRGFSIVTTQHQVDLLIGITLP
jgi:hypothetical protein